MVLKILKNDNLSNSVAVQKQCCGHGPHCRQFSARLSYGEEVLLTSVDSVVKSRLLILPKKLSHRPLQSVQHTTPSILIQEFILHGCDSDHFCICMGGIFVTNVINEAS